MTPYLNYLIAASIGLLMLFTSYWLLFRNETSLSFLRYYLLSCLGVSMLLPLIPLPEIGIFNGNSFNSMGSIYIPPVTLSGQVIVPPDNTAKVWQVQDIAWGIYFTVQFVLLVRLFIQLDKIFVLLRHHKTSVYKNRYRVVEAPSQSITFSFFNIILLGDVSTISEAERQKILDHEVAHSRGGHSFDLLLTEVAIVILWFNPLIYLFKRELTSIHEYEADRSVSDTQDIQMYCSLLAKVALKSTGYPLANHFNKSLTVKRIAMMKRAKKEISNWKLLGIIPALLVFFITVSCKDDVIDELSDSTLSQTTEYPSEVMNDLIIQKGKFPNGVFTYLEGDENEIRKLADRYAGKMIVNTYEFKERRTIGLLLQDLPELQAADGAFFYVEQPAQFPGGFAAFHLFVKQNWNKDLATTTVREDDRVFVGFNVNADGSISNVELVKGCGDSKVDAEAIRVMRLSPNWAPAENQGETVRQRMVLPIVLTDRVSAQFSSKGNIEAPRANPYSLFVDSFQKETLDGKLVLSGIVKDANGKPVVGTNVVIRGTRSGTVANLEGKFKLIAPQSSGEVVFAFVGYETVMLDF